MIRKFLFDDPLSNFFHMHTGNGLEEVLEISFIVDVVRPDEDSQVREAAEVWRVEATEVDLYILLIGIFEERVCKK